MSTIILLMFAALVILAAVGHGSRIDLRTKPKPGPPSGSMALSYFQAATETNQDRRLAEADSAAISKGKPGPHPGHPGHPGPADFQTESAAISKGKPGPHPGHPGPADFETESAAVSKGKPGPHPGHPGPADIQN